MRTILHPIVVACLVDAECEKYEARKKKEQAAARDAPTRRLIARHFNQCIREQRERYAKVRLARTRRGWLLVYAGEATADGTGPFDTAREAVAWFLNGGR